ncbi:MAG: hypothetical protein IJ920_07565 [Paludibacteraceae bacterium]|nr:hypothetical protein [Paludibacteraceae bacterium]
MKELMNERIKELEIMKALRYLLILVAVMGVLSVSAQTPKYGKPYNPGNRTYYNPQAQMPAIQMQSTGSAIMFTGSALPSAATEGVTTTYTSTNGKPRRAKMGDDDWEDDTLTGEQTENPWKNPIGDAMWPLMVCALAYLIIRVVRKRTRA